MRTFRKGAARNVIARCDVPIVGLGGNTVCVRNELTLSCGHKAREYNLPYTDEPLSRRCFKSHKRERKAKAAVSA